MKKILISLAIFLLFLLIIFLIMFLDKTPYLIDSDILYTKKINNNVLQVRRYDYSLGQRMVIGVEKSNNNGKKYWRKRK